jgi:hypothetical protein
MRKTLLVRQVLPSLGWYVLLIVAALGTDWLLHRIGLEWVGRHLGIVGSAFLIASFGYSLRKRKLIQRGSPKTLLGLHEALSWIGAALILVHAGVHFNALLPWAAVVAMLVVVASGFTGKYLLKEAREKVRLRAASPASASAEAGEPESRLFLDALTVEAMQRWRIVHLPLTTVFATLAVLHVLAIVIFWRW